MSILLVALIMVFGMTAIYMRQVGLVVMRIEQIDTQLFAKMNMAVKTIVISLCIMVMMLYVFISRI